jgi:hypothetical protein
MEMKVTITGQTELIAMLNNVAKRQLPFACAKALTLTANKCKEKLIEHMGVVFDRPTPFVKRGLYVRPATKDTLQSEVGISYRAIDILGHHVEGGVRPEKRSEHWLGSYYLPGQAMPLNQYGNISQGKITQILSGVFKNPDPMSWTTARSRQRKRKRARPFYFLIPNIRGIESATHLYPGIYQRFGKRKIKPALIFMKKEPTYSKRYDFYGIGRRTALSSYGAIFDKAMADAMRTAR